MKLHSFQELTSRIVNLSTRDGKPISITFSGENAYTNTKTVNIPTLPSGTILSQSQFSIWLGYVIHEGPGHQSHTDLNLYANSVISRKNPTFSYILNLLEDIRIENADIKIYPGDRKYLDSVHHFVDQKIPKNLAQNPDILGLIYKQLFVQHRNLNTNIIQGNLDPETAKLISEIDLCISTQDCVTLADKIAAYLKKKQEEQKEQEKNNKNSQEKQQGEEKQNSDNNSSDQNQEENQEENSQSNGEGNDEDSNDNSESSESSNPDSSQNSQSSQDQDANSDQETPSQTNSGQIDPSQIDIWQEITEIKNIIQSLKDQTETKDEPNHPHKEPDQNLEGKSIFPPKNILNDQIYVPSQEDLSQYNQTRSSCTSQILSLKKMFRIYLQSQTKKATLRGLEEGKLDHQRLHIAACGENTIFKDQTTKLLPETAIELMIDMSGSMNDNIARTAAIILAEALNSIPQIKLSISGFTTNNLGRENRNYYFQIPPNSGRQIGMDILQFKNFSEPYQKCKAKLGAITSRGATPLGDAYGKSLEHIIPRPEPRRIIFLITDGQPEYSHGINHSDFLLMKKIHLTAKKYKIQTLGLGIGRDLDFLKNYFDQAINIRNTQDLPQNLLSALKRFI